MDEDYAYGELRFTGHASGPKSENRAAGFPPNLAVGLEILQLGRHQPGQAKRPRR
jgi:hypothetical protein